MDYDDFGTYNGEAEHDMWVDYDQYVNTGEPDYFDDEIVDDGYDYDGEPDSDFD